MSTSIGNLAVMLSANTSRFTTGINRAAGDTRRFSTQANTNIARVGGSLQSLGRIAMRVAPLLGIGLGIGALTGELRRLDDAAKQAARLGDTTENISRLQFAGEQTGASVETLSKSIESMTRRISEATTGTGEAKDALEELGLSADVLNSMAPTQAFAEIAEALKGVDVQADKVRLTYDLFGRSGLDLVNTLDLGRDGLNAFAAQSDKLGNTIRTGASKEAEKFNDAVNALKRAVGGAAAELVTSLTPALRGVVDLLSTGISAVQNVNTSIAKNVIQVAAMAAGFAAGAVAIGKIISIGVSLVNTFKNVTKAAAVMQIVLNPLAFAKIAAGIALAVGAGLAVEKAFSGASKSMEATASQASAIVASLDSVGETAASATPEIDKLSKKIMDTFTGDGSNRPETIAAEYVSAVGEVQSAIAELQTQAASIFDATRTPAERFAKQLKEIKELAGAGFIDEDTARRAIAQISDAQRDQIINATAMPPDMNPQRVNFAALGAEQAAGRGQDKIEKNTAEEVRESKKQTGTLAELLSVARNASGAKITQLRF